MDKEEVEALIENEREWRRFVVNKIESIETRLAENEKWTFGIRILSASAFALLCAWVGAK